MEQVENKYLMNAFVSCSLREEDKPFVDFVERILKAYKTKPFGTVGKYSVSPENPIVLMKRNIPIADLIVICATPRYIQKDLQTGKVSYGLPEMVHVEAGMAYMANKPVIVFVQEGVNIGSFIPNVTQYIVLNGEYEDFNKKKNQVYSLLNNAHKMITDIKNSKELKMIGRIALWGLALYGAYIIVRKLFK
jgi:hypothetical protein